MHRSFMRTTMFALATTCAFTGAALAQSREAAAVRKVQQRQAEAWNRHDAAAYAALFTEDGDVVNVLGWWWKGRPQIENKLAAAFAFVFRESTLTITDVDVRFVAPDVAVAHVLWTMAGAKTPKGVPEPKQGIQLQVLKKEQGKWLIASFQNTNSIPETAFPAGPPQSGPSAAGKP